VFIEIDDLKDEPLHVQHVYPIGALPFDHDDAALGEPVSTDFVLTHEERDLRVGGTVTTAVRYNCARCLKEFVRPLSTRFDLCYLPQPRFKADEEIELKYEDMEIGYYDGLRLDVDLMILEQIELSMPMKFVCRESCKGLCHLCGADLNEVSCLCKREDTDPRMSVLLEFRKKMDK